MRTKNNKEHVKTIMVFGVFDRLHPGHLSFLKQAKHYGEKLIVVVARDSVVRELKNKNPEHGEKERMVALCKLPEVNKVLLGDKKQGSYGVIKKYKPEIICLGYDQQTFLQDLRKKMRSGIISKVKLVRLHAHKSEKFHSSLLNHE